MLVGIPLLTVSANPFCLPMTCTIRKSVPRYFWPIARSLVRPPANLFAVENFVYQQFADVLSPPHSNTGCQANYMWLLS